MRAALHAAAVADGEGPVARDVETSDGFEIARRDLAIRGPGEFMGARQSGDALLRFADLQDTGLIERARAAAERVLEGGPRAAEAQVERWLASRADYLNA